MNYELYLPFPPSVNHYYVKTRRGVYISKKGREFRGLVADAINEQLPAVELGPDQRLKVKVVLYPRDKRTRDIDNYNKALLDAITQAGLWSDDSQIDQLFNYRGAIIKGGQVQVIISPADNIKPTP